MHDESVYPNPHTFNPNRFLKNGTIDIEVQDPRDMFFGFGKRQCPGNGIALAELYLIMANILKLFNIEYPLDKDGKEYIPETSYGSGIVTGPHPFPCRFTPRSSSSVELIRNALDHI